jgi:hypothetical protein
VDQALIKFDTKNLVPDAAYAHLNPQEESLADGIESSYGIIGYKGKTWSLRYGGQTHYFTRADDGTGVQSINVIVLAQARTKSKSYFEHWEDGSTAPPICWSMDSITPDSDVPEPTPDGKGRQSQSCALCPRNAWYPNPDMPGKKKRDCNDYKRVAVLLGTSDTQRMLGHSLTAPVFLRVPAASLEPLALLGDQLQKAGIHFASVITRIEFDKEKPFPLMIFSAIELAPAKLAPLITELREDPKTGRIVGFSPTGIKHSSGVVALSTDHIDHIDHVVPVANKTASAPMIELTATTVATASSPPVSAPVSASAPAQTATATDTGFGAVEQATPVSASVVAVAGTDTGPPTAAEADLDARIAALMPK